MTEPDRRDKRSDRSLSRQVGRKAVRRLRSRSEQRRTVWFGLGMFGLVGWAVAVPTLLGIGLGAWLDGRFPQETVSWTLTFLVIGIVVGCLNAWFWIRQESRDD